MEDNKDIPNGEPIAKMYKRLKEERERVVPTLGEDCHYYHEFRDEPDDFMLLIAQTLKDRELNVLIQPEVREHKLGGYYLTGGMNVWLDKEARGWLNQIKSCQEVRALDRAHSGIEPEIDECSWSDQTKKRIKALYWRTEKNHTDHYLASLISEILPNRKRLEMLKHRNETAVSNLDSLKGEGIEPFNLDEVRGLVVEAVDEEIKSEKTSRYWD